MKKKSLLILVLVTLMCGCGFENRKGYYFDNHRYNYVRLERFKDAGDKNINHPYTFGEPQISTILKMLEIDKGVVFTDNVKEKSVFDSYSIGKLTPPIVKAFAEATPKERIGFSFLVKDPKFVIKNDRLTNGWMWVEDDKLHIEFDLLYVKMSADTDKRGYDAMWQLAEKARGLRISFDLQPGQSYGDSTKEIVVDTKVAAVITEERLQKEKELAEKGVDADVKIEVIKDKDARERLKELDTLKKERMITEEEYQKKRKEILGEL